MTRVLIDEETDLVPGPTLVPVIEQARRWPLGGYEYLVQLPSGRNVVVQEEEIVKVN